MATKRDYYEVLGVSKSASHGRLRELLKDCGLPDHA